MTRNRGPKFDLLPPPPEAWRVEKKQVVCAELASAIRLFFNGDYIAAHVLAGAALDILKGLAKAKGVPTSWEESKHVVAEGYENAFLSLKTADYNFFKHAMTDSGGVRDRYQPAITALIVFEACSDFIRVYPDKPYFEPTLFVAWMCLWAPSFVKPDNKTWFEPFNSELRVVPGSDLWLATEGARKTLKMHDDNLEMMEQIAVSLLRAGRELHLEPNQ